jgi:2,3-bisphosphoglycerate-independent phosphoglycerate mutase
VKKDINSPVALLVILDGWGFSEVKEMNAIANAKTPNWDKLWKESPHTLLNTSGAAVGLPNGQMGNSEVGHLNLGAGRVVYQEFTRVSRSIRTGSFFSNQTLTKAIDQAILTDKAVHILGLLSQGGVHSHEEHIHAMAELVAQRGCKHFYLHAFLDGRDTAPKGARESILKMDKVFAKLGRGRIASVIGRYYAMDRDHRWPRIQESYDLLTQAKAEFEAPDAITALEMAYKRGESDEFVRASRIVGNGMDPVVIKDGDVVIFMNYRSDRARQITRPFIESAFNGFSRDVFPRLGAFVTLTEYSKEFDIPSAYPPERLKNVFGEYIARQGLRQLRIAETEKYAHVTFFFNGGREEPFEGEDRILVPSPKVATYDLKPEMSAQEVTERLVNAIDSRRYDVIICNYSNADMVGHTGNYSAATQAIEVVDQCIGKVADAIRRNQGQMLITADHGNAEQMIDNESHQPHTAHTNNPVPLIYLGEQRVMLQDNGSLCDIAPSMLEMMGMVIPTEMGGRSLLNKLQ